MATQVAILGDPVAHSLSPAMHNAAFAELGMYWRYQAIRVSADRFETEVRSLESRGYVGANVTVPHKVRALEVADQASDAAAEIGAANTLSFREGKIFAENTDAGGFLDALDAVGLTLKKGVKVLLLGAGGTARAASWVLLNKAKVELKVWNRTVENADELVKVMEDCFDTDSIQRIEDPDEDAAAYNLIVNTTSVGLEADRAERDELAALKLTASSFHEGQTVVDFVYRSGGTGIINSAKRSGARTVDGVEILVLQGARSFEVWTGREAPVSVMRKAVIERIR